jgi:hypothetical protein
MFLSPANSALPLVKPRQNLKKKKKTNNIPKINYENLNLYRVANKYGLQLCPERYVRHVARLRI